MNKLQDLQVIEKDMSTSAVEALQAENRELRIEVSALSDSLLTHDSIVESLQDKKVECGQLKTTNNDLRAEVAQLRESALSLEANSFSLQEKKVAYEQMATERDDLKESLDLFEKEETSALLEFKTKHLNLQNELDDVKLNFETFKEDTAATLQDKHTESQKLSQEILELQCIAQTSQETELALQEKKIEIEKLLNAVDNFREAIACGRLEVKQLNEALEAAKADLVEAKVQGAEALRLSQQQQQQQQQQCSENKASTDSSDCLSALEGEIENLTQGHSDLESIAAEKSLEVSLTLLLIALI